MKKQFVDYLRKSGLVTKTQKARFFDLYHIVGRFMPEEPQFVFLSKPGKDKVVSEIDDLWFFSKRYAVEARKFLHQDDVEVIPLAGLKGLRVLSKNFNWESLKPKPGIAGTASLRVEFQSASNKIFSLDSFSEQCCTLGLIVIDCLRPNL